MIRQIRITHALVATAILLGVMRRSHAELSLTINQPTPDKKVVLSQSMTIQGTVSYPEKKKKEEEAVIVWSLEDEFGQLIDSTKSGETKEMDLDVAFPASNNGFGHKTLTATVNKRQITGDGKYEGDDSLDETIMDQDGENHQGYVVNNLSPDEQDMVIDDDTSGKEGCVYRIGGYCTEAHKGIPGNGRIFGQPWTSNDPNHWAYWVRQAVVYANQNGSSNDDKLYAIWHITDRSGYYNQILAAIQYDEESGPTRVKDSVPPSVPVSFQAKPGDQQVALSWINPPESDFIGVKILCRTDGQYPASPSDGAVVVDLAGNVSASESYLHSGLLNGTTYQYSAFAYDDSTTFSAAAHAIVTPTGSSDAMPPAAPTGFTATPQKGKIALHWINPTASDFQGTLIVYNIDGVYPKTPSDGAVACDRPDAAGSADSFTHENLTNGRTYLYSAFARDASGNYSAPAKAYSVPPADMGTVVIDVLPVHAPWLLIDGIGKQHDGRGDAWIQAPAGQITLRWPEMDGYDSPSPVTKALAANGHVSFVGYYLWSEWDSLRTCTQVLAYLAGLTTDTTDLDANSDSRINIADLVVLFPACVPGAPEAHSPWNGQTNVYLDVSFRWDNGDMTETNDLYVWKMGQSKPLTPTVSNLTSAYYITRVDSGTTYSWQVVSRNTFAATAGPEWAFATTEQKPIFVSVYPIVCHAGDSMTVDYTANSHIVGDTMRIELWREGHYVTTLLENSYNMGYGKEETVTVPSVSPGSGYRVRVISELLEGLGSSDAWSDSEEITIE